MWQCKGPILAYGIFVKIIVPFSNMTFLFKKNQQFMLLEIIYLGEMF